MCCNLVHELGTISLQEIVTLPTSQVRILQTTPFPVVQLYHRYIGGTLLRLDFSVLLS